MILSNQLRKWLFCSVFALLSISSIFAQKTKWNPNTAKLSDKIPVYDSIRTGVLKNGMKYFIRKNAEPLKRAEMRLAVNAGSVLENDDQQGLAHFCEHMAFNGTKNFKKSEVVDYLESIGMKFGADLNAYTSFDETVYMLQVPTDKPEFITKGLQILEDWAHNVSFENTEIDKERGVVIEEWRLGKGAFDRLGKKTLPIELYQSRYADRLPIGKKEILESFKYDAAKSFYKDWYRPDLQAIIIVGDVDLDKMEAMVKKQFSAIPVPSNEKARPAYGLPDFKDTKVAIATDKEMPYNMVSLTYKHAKTGEGTVKDYRESIVRQIFSELISARLKELTQSANAPFVFAQAGISPFYRDKAAYSVFGLAGPAGIEACLKGLLEENEKVRKYGFTQSELDRIKKEVLRQFESSYNERDKTESKELAAECVRHFLTDETMPGIAAEFEMHKRFIPEITLAEVNALATDWIKNGNNTIIITAPDKEGVVVPTEAKVREILREVQSKDVVAYKDVNTDIPLMAAKPAPGKITGTKTIPELGITELILSNGSKVIYKKTDYKNDQVVFSAYSPGGTSLVADKDFISASLSAEIINNSGIAQFDNNTLQKMLTGKIANVSPSISELSEGFSGEAAPQDMETMFQMLNLYFTAPRKDQNGFDAFKTQMVTFVENNTLTPEGVFSDTIQKVVSQGHFRMRPFSKALLNELNFDDAYRLYKERFANPGNFLFFFVGNIDEAKFTGLVETYIASLPAGNHETWKDNHINTPNGVIKRSVKKGVEPKSSVRMNYNGSFDWSFKNRTEARATMSILNIMMRETMREDKSGVYGVGAGFMPTHYPTSKYTISIRFGCAPNNVDMLIATAKEQITTLKKEGPSAKNLEKVKETMRREFETNLRTNNFWISALNLYYSNGDNIKDLLEYNKIVDSITPETIKALANKYFNDANYDEFTLYPEK